MSKMFKSKSWINIYLLHHLRDLRLFGLVPCNNLCFEWLVWRWQFHCSTYQGLNAPAIPSFRGKRFLIWWLWFLCVSFFVRLCRQDNPPENLLPNSPPGRKYFQWTQKEIKRWSSKTGKERRKREVWCVCVWSCLQATERRGATWRYCWACASRDVEFYWCQVPQYSFLFLLLDCHMYIVPTTWYSIYFFLVLWFQEKSQMVVCAILREKLPPEMGKRRGVISGTLYFHIFDIVRLLFFKKSVTILVDCKEESKIP